MKDLTEGLDEKVAALSKDKDKPSLEMQMAIAVTGNMLARLAHKLSDRPGSQEQMNIWHGVSMAIVDMLEEFNDD